MSDETRDKPWIDHRAVAAVEAMSWDGPSARAGAWDVRDGPPPASDASEKLKGLGIACIALYGNDMRDPALQISLAALAQNVMFQRVVRYARRAELMIELDRVDAEIKKGF